MLVNSSPYVAPPLTLLLIKRGDGNEKIQGESHKASNPYPRLPGLPVATLREGRLPTDVLDGFHEPGADVSLVVVFYRDALVQEMSLKVIGAVGGDVQQCCDPQRVEHVPAGRMISTAEVEEREDLHGTPLQQKEAERPPPGNHECQQPGQEQ